jgi:hypothetical protein
MKRKIGLRHTLELSRGCMKIFSFSLFAFSFRPQFEMSLCMFQFSERFLPVEKKGEKRKIIRRLSFNKDYISVQ